MSSNLEKIDDDQGLLLMYLADELSQSAKAHVQRRLAAEPALAADFARIESTHATLTDAIELMDSQMPLRISSSAAAGRVGRLMRQWAAGRLARPSMTIAPKQLPLPWWCYPLVSAACLAMVVTVWSIHRNNDHLSDSYAVDSAKKKSYYNSLSDDAVATDNANSANNTPLTNNPDSTNSNLSNNNAVAINAGSINNDAANGGTSAAGGVNNNSGSTPDKVANASSPVAIDTSAETSDELLYAAGPGSDMTDDMTDDSDSVIAAAPPSDSIDNIFAGLGSELDVRE